MDRAAVFIESSNVSGLSDLPGARKDVETFRRFLHSFAGGDWSYSEFKTLNKPSQNELEDAISEAGEADYSFVTFSGHGYHAQGKEVDETILHINEKLEWPAYKLNTGSDRCTVVVDACRGIVRLGEEERQARAMVEKFALAVPKKGHRQLFDRAVQSCEKGAVFLYSCDLDEEAGENSQGGFFSLFLVRTGEAWFEMQRSNKNMYLPINQAFNGAKKMTSNRMPQQNAVYEPGRRVNHFPFSVYIA